MIGILGAALPMFITMQLIRHKTRHKKFMWGLPAAVLLHAVLFGVWLFYLPELL